MWGREGERGGRGKGSERGEAEDDEGQREMKSYGKARRRDEDVNGGGGWERRCGECEEKGKGRWKAKWEGKGKSQCGNTWFPQFRQKKLKDFSRHKLPFFHAQVAICVQNGKNMLMTEIFS